MMQQAFARTLERGQTFPLELGHGEGNRWYVLELNGDQRESARRALGSGRGDIRRERERSSLVSGVLIAKPGRSGRSNAMSIGGNLR